MVKIKPSEITPEHLNYSRRECIAGVAALTVGTIFLGACREDIFEKRFAVVGFAAFLLLLPLALTSTRGWIIRLGRNWKRLHLLIYPAAALAIIHFIWLEKADIREPLIYGIIVALLLVLRLPVIKKLTHRLSHPSGKDEDNEPSL